jgi:thiamine biosynthesis lipoprotein
MPITVEIVSDKDVSDLFDRVYAFFAEVDSNYSPFKTDSMVARVNRRELAPTAAGDEMLSLLSLADLTRQQTGGYFNVWRDGRFDPSGIVKGWAIYQAATIIREAGFTDFDVDAGGDIQIYGCNPQAERWRVGICNPFDPTQVVKTLAVTDCGVATSGLYQRGRHIYNPHAADDLLDDIVSLTVVGPNVFEADRFVTAAFAMGRAGIAFIESRPGFEGYMIDHDGIATLSSGLGRFLL